MCMEFRARGARWLRAAGSRRALVRAVACGAIGVSIVCGGAQGVAHAEDARADAPLGSPVGGSDAARLLDAAWSMSERIAKGEGDSPLRDLVFRWRAEDLYVPSASELSALRAIVETDPAHPRGAELAEFERRIAQGTPLVRHYSLRSAGPDRWRLTEDSGVQGGEVAFVDYVWTPDAAWKLTPTWLVRIDPDRPMPDGHPLRDIGAYFRHDLMLLVDGGISTCAPYGAGPGRTFPGPDGAFLVYV